MKTVRRSSNWTAHSIGVVTIIDQCGNSGWYFWGKSHRINGRCGTFVSFLRTKTYSKGNILYGKIIHMNIGKLVI